MSLLSEQEKAEIRAAVKSVTDTFMVSPILYHIAKSSIDVWQEDGSKDRMYYTIALNALVEEKERVMEEDEEGSKDWMETKLTFNLEDLDAVGLIREDNGFVFNIEEDYFTLRGRIYKVNDIYFDGPLEDKNVLLIVQGRLTYEGGDFSTVISHYDEI